MKKESGLKYKKLKYILKNKFQIVKGKFSVTIFLCLSFLLLLQIFLTITVTNKSMANTFSYFITNKSTEIVLKNEKIIENARLNLANLSQETEIKKFLANIDTNDEEIKDILNNYKNYLYTVEQIYIYRSADNSFLTFEHDLLKLQYDDIAEKPVLDVVKSRLENSSFGMLLGYKGVGYAYNLYTVYYPFNSTHDAIILRFKFDDFINNINTFDFKDSFICILNPDNSVFFSTHIPESASNINNVLKEYQNKKNGIYKIKTEGEEFVLMKKNSTVMNKSFYFVCAKDEIYVTDNISIIFFLTITLILLFINFVFMFKFLNKKLQKQIKITHKKVLEESVRGKRETVVREFITSHGKIDKQQLEMINFTFVKDEPLKVLLLFIDDYEVFLAKYSNLKDRELYKYGIQNIICEIFERHGIKSESTSLEAEKILFLTDGTVNNYKIEAVLNEARSYVKEALGVGYTVVISRTVYSYNITEILSSLYEMKKYKFIYGNDSVLIQEIIMNRIIDSSHEKYEELVNNLKIHLLKEELEVASQIFSSITVFLKNGEFEKLLLRISFLADSLNSVYEKLNSKKNFKSSFNSIDIVGKIMEASNFDSAFKICKEILKEIFELYESEPSDKSKKICNNIISIIEENYHDVSFSINKIAEELGFSVNYLNKLFKEQCNESIPKYILRFRLEVAKRLLKDTDFTIIQISKMIGMNSSSHFGSLFKKHEKMTPNEYRLLGEK